MVVVVRWLELVGGATPLRLFHTWKAPCVLRVVVVAWLPRWVHQSDAVYAVEEAEKKEAPSSSCLLCLGAPRRLASAREAASRRRRRRSVAAHSPKHPRHSATVVRR